MTGALPLSIDTPQSRPARIALIVFGIAAIGFVTRQVYQGLCPVTPLTPFYVLVLGLGLAAGLEAVHGGLLGWSDRWDIQPGRIIINRRNLFWRRQVVVGADAIDSLALVETRDQDDETRWLIELRGRSGQRFRTREFSPRANAERFLEKMVETVRSPRHEG